MKRFTFMYCELINNPLLFIYSRLFLEIIIEPWARGVEVDHHSSLGPLLGFISFFALSVSLFHFLPRSTRLFLLFERSPGLWREAKNDVKHRKENEVTGLDI